MRRTWLWFVVMIAGGLLPAAALAQERNYEWEWGMHPVWWMWGAWGIGMGLLMLVFWGLVIAVIALGIRWLVRQGREPGSSRALDILRERYARGEINKDEFEAKRRDLS